MAEKGEKQAGTRVLGFLAQCSPHGTCGAPALVWPRSGLKALILKEFSSQC